MSDNKSKAESQSSVGANGVSCRRGCRRKGNRRQCKRLSDLECGETGTIECVECGRPNLHSMGVRPGKRITVCTKHPFDGPVVVSVGRSTVSLSRSHARQLEVTTEQ
ncbi:FeoA family protein [Halalkalirubrum salinum]|uniref:FeoA family protein n=1 Tax=Halalkalirubrum salinum TaxID=2563889 RepID=UPI0010FBABFC